MSSEWWSLNSNLGLCDYKAAQPNPHVLLRREPEEQHGHSIPQQVKARVWDQQCNSSVFGRPRISEAGFHSAPPVEKLSVLRMASLSLTCTPIVVPTFSHNSHHPHLVNTLPKICVWFCFDMNKRFQATWGGGRGGRVANWW